MNNITSPHHTPPKSSLLPHLYISYRDILLACNLLISLNVVGDRKITYSRQAVWQGWTISSDRGMICTAIVKDVEHGVIRHQ